MYVCNIRFIVCSSEGRIGSLLENIPLPERTTVSTLTCAGLGEKVNSIDTVVIFDGLESFERDGHLVGEWAKSVLITDRPVESPEDIKADALWLCPTEEYISFYAKRFISHMKRDFDLRRLNACFETAFDSIPDLVWFKDTKGSHLWVNDSFCGAVGKTKAQVFDRGHYYIWDIPKEEYDEGEYVCLESEDIVVAAGQTCLFDEKVKTKEGMKQFKTYKSPLFDVDGRLFGTCGVANDVTSLHNVNSEVEAILETMPFAVLVEDEKGKVVSVSSRFFEYFPKYRENPEQWRDEILADNSEITINGDNGTVILTVFKKTIYSIFHDVVGRLIILTDVTKEHEARERILSNANTDFLTGLFNRRRLNEYMNNISGGNIAVITVDLDNFKSINDTYGHAVGDTALIDTAKTLCSCFEKDFIARLGGDEFLIVCTREGTAESFAEEGEKLLDELQKVFRTDKRLDGMHASAGIAVGSTDIGAEELIRRSDSALYRAKAEGKNCVRVFSDQ